VLIIFKRTFVAKVPQTTSSCHNFVVKKERFYQFENEAKQLIHPELLTFTGFMAHFFFYSAVLNETSI
jgi:hypothetical protein